jgi:hypothetical protein
MFSHGPSLRPADNLPPTLLPNPVRAVAPSPRRLLSLSLACGCYGVMAALAVASARQVAACGRHPVTVAANRRTGPPAGLQGGRSGCGSGRGARAGGEPQGFPGPLP